MGACCYFPKKNQPLSIQIELPEEIPEKIAEEIADEIADKIVNASSKNLPDWIRNEYISERIISS
jgi:hypothetical protein